ncbi:MAG: hypothetical protein JO236_15560 [Mycobacterium sp.]|uniref:hypothetical protein n=1 Tax=Mycobacterium sp. TaxID=1785 RepID=UPI001EB1D558|nr:hypothetical protein [Mycobacterium sp.]MBW0018944.1 hypothetical protein [Mycobacterium sp.]
MRLVAESGLWSAGPRAEPLGPLTAVLEVSGAVFSWTIDDPPTETATQISFTDLSRADWLWRIVGEAGHVMLVSAVDRAGQPQSLERLDLHGVEILPGSINPLRRLAIGHWLRRWWPASQRDGIAALDRALLDVEVALLTFGAQCFFTDDTLDSDVAELLAPHAAALLTRVGTDDARIRDLVRVGAGLADEIEIDGPEWPELFAAVDDSSALGSVPSPRQDDYALAAGSDGTPSDAAAIVSGVASLNWSAVPPRIFDASENTVDWSVRVDGTTPVAVVRAAVIGPDPATGVELRVLAGTVTGDGMLEADGRASLPLFGAEHLPLTESAAWNHDWAATSVIVGAPISGATESSETRERVRRWVRARLDSPPDDAYLAEILASESTY